MQGNERDLDAEMSGLDALELRDRVRQGPAWLSVGAWLAALIVALGLWQVLVWTHWRPEAVLPGPLPVLHRLIENLNDGDLTTAVLITLKRAALGYAAAVLVGTVLGIGLSRSKILRASIGSLITGLQTMPSIAWFPLAILLFALGEPAIIFVVVLGAAPAIASGLVTAIDHIPPVLLRAGRVLGAQGFAALRAVILPAALPGFLAGLKQGWAFAWRSLMAGELLVVVADRPSIGARLQFARELSDAPELVAWMVVILFIGMAVDAVFGVFERTVRRRRGLIETL